MRIRFHHILLVAGVVFIAIIYCSRRKTAEDPFISQVKLVRSGKSTGLDMLGMMSSTNIDFDEISRLDRLTWLRLDKSTVSDDDLKKLTKLSALGTVYLSETHISNAGLASLSKNKSLRHLVLDSTPVTDDGMKYLKALPHLNRLSLWNCFITDRGCQTIAGFPELEELSLDSTQVTDTGIRHLESLKSLKKLSVWKTKVTDKGILALKDRLPHVNVNK